MAPSTEKRNYLNSFLTRDLGNQLSVVVGHLLEV
jgi:hypothetical protein